MIKLNQYINVKIRNIFIVLVLTSVFLESFFSIYSLGYVRQKERNQLFSDFQVILKDPINQGSHIEAYDRISKYVGKNGISCISVLIGDDLFGSCPRNGAPLLVEFKPGSFLNTTSVSLSVSIDDSDIWKRELISFAVRLGYYMCALFFISTILKRNILFIGKEIDLIKENFEKNNVGANAFNIAEFESLSNTLTDLSIKSKAAERYRVSAEIAKKLAHDIRSPLSVINIISTKFRQEFPLEGDLLSVASRQIINIAENLLKQQRDEIYLTEDTSKENCSAVAEIKKAGIEKVVKCCAEVVDQKKIEFSDKPHIQLNFYPDVGVNFHVSADVFSLKAIISNLINNSFEAIEGNGFISISISDTYDAVLIEIRDSGKGIPDEVLAKLTIKPFTYGKTNGNGIGLYSANQDIIRWGGGITIYSTVGSGTTIQLMLRKHDLI